ncbi:MAG: hypothetical protein U0805_22835 [Pirellulales bacterium]
MAQREIRIPTLTDEEVARYRAMTPAERLQLVSDLNTQARVRAASRLKLEHPDWTDPQILAEVARLMLSGDEEYFK